MPNASPAAILVNSNDSYIYLYTILTYEIVDGFPASLPKSCSKYSPSTQNVISILIDSWNDTGYVMVESGGKSVVYHKATLTPYYVQFPFLKKICKGDEIKFTFSRDNLGISKIQVIGMYSAVKALNSELPYYSEKAEAQEYIDTIYSEDGSKFDVFVNNNQVSAPGGVVGYGLNIAAALGETKYVEIRKANSQETIDQDYATALDIRFVSGLGKWQQIILPVGDLQAGVPTLLPGSGSIMLPKTVNQPIIDQWVQTSVTGKGGLAAPPGYYELQVLADDQVSWVPFCNFVFDGAKITLVKHYAGVSAGLLIDGVQLQEYREIRLWITASVVDERKKPELGDTPLTKAEPSTPTIQIVEPIQPEGQVVLISEPVEPDPIVEPIEPDEPVPVDTTIPVPNGETCVCSPWYAAISQAIVNSGSYIAGSILNIVYPILQIVASCEKLRYQLVNSISQYLQHVEKISLELEYMRKDICKGVNNISPEIANLRMQIKSLNEDIYESTGKLTESIDAVADHLVVISSGEEQSLARSAADIADGVSNPAGLIQQEISCGIDASGALKVYTKSINESEEY